MKAVFVELPAFERRHADYLDDEAFRDLQQVLMENPAAGRPGRRTDGEDGTMKKQKRDLFAEIAAGIDALAAQRTGKRTLRTHTVTALPAPKISARELTQLRKQLNLSRGLFAGYLRTNVRTLENWEQGRARPNAQAALLIRLVQRYPDTVQRLAEI
jgi:putative transcriptional regulator